MKGNIKCPRCTAQGRKPKILGKYEEIRGSGTIYLWCRSCRKEIPIHIEEISLDR